MRCASTDGAVTEFNEKPQATEGFINGGFFVLDAKRVWAYLGTAPSMILEREPLQNLSRDGRAGRLSSTPASGSRWTPTRVHSSSTSSGPRARPPGRAGTAATGKRMEAELRAYAGRRVLVTGHTGFKGSWLTLWLARARRRSDRLRAGARDRPQPLRRGRGAECVPARRGRRAGPRALRAVLREAQPEVVFHLAAQALVRRSYSEPLETLQHERDGHGEPARGRAAGAASGARSSSSPATSATRTASGRSATARTTRWAATTSTR